MAFQPVDFNYFLARKYALQQQEADATTTNAGSSRIQAEANAGVAATQAKMNTVQTSLMPGESASQNALRRAQALLLGEQASVVRPESEANIGVSRANAMLTGLQGQVALGPGIGGIPFRALSHHGRCHGRRRLPLRPGLGDQAAAPPG